MPPHISGSVGNSRSRSLDHPIHPRLCSYPPFRARQTLGIVPIPILILIIVLAFEFTIKLRGKLLFRPPSTRRQARNELRPFVP